MWPGGSGSPFAVLVAARPVGALPGVDLPRLDEKEPARLVEGGNEVLRSVLAEIAQGHLVGDLDPTPADVRLFDHLRLALGLDLDVRRIWGIDRDRDAPIVGHVLGPRRAGARDDIEPAVRPLVPGGNNIGPTCGIEAAESGDISSREKDVQLLLAQLADLAAPFFTGGGFPGGHHHSSCLT